VSWDGTRVLVTGAGGFIGSHLAERLVKEGARVRALVRYTSHGSWGWLEDSSVRDDMEVVAGDVRDPEFVRGAVDSMAVVFHLAALIAIPYSYQAPVSYLQANVEGTLNVLQASRRVGVDRLVVTSTSEVYGTARYAPIDEAHPLQAQSPYAASKIAADKFAESFHLSFGLPVVTVRPFNTFGPRQSARAVIPTIVTQCLTGGPLRLGNLHPTRDLNFVANTVDGFLLAASSPAALGRVVNIGSGVETSIGELAQRIRVVTGHAGDLIVDGTRVRREGSEVERLVCDSTFARTALGWEPAVPLSEGLEATIEWIARHLPRYKAGVYSI
jgi:dTDP-glucose 4,6-dehydratase